MIVNNILRIDQVKKYKTQFMWYVNSKAWLNSRLGGLHMGALSVKICDTRLDNFAGGPVSQRMRETFAKNLKDLKGRTFKTNKELARLIGAKEATVSAYMRGERFPSPEDIDKIAAAVGMQGYELLVPDVMATRRSFDNPVDALNSVIEYFKEHGITLDKKIDK